jgi:phage tail protein X
MAKTKREGEFRMITYSTIQGDMWDMIAFRLTGSYAGMSELIRANPEYGEYVIFPAGIVLNVPEFTEDVADTLPPWMIGGESV